MAWVAVFWSRSGCEIDVDGVTKIVELLREGSLNQSWVLKATGGDLMHNHTNGALRKSLMRHFNCVPILLFVAICALGCLASEEPVDITVEQAQQN
ncbi:MAG TPA: hypothetical protein VI756_15360, partial [Blastocatellia bacterium]